METAEARRSEPVPTEASAAGQKQPKPAAFSLDSVPPVSARALDNVERSPANAPTARPNRPANPQATTAGPPRSQTPTGLELVDLSLDSISDLEIEAARASAMSQRDPRDPVLELELELDSAPKVPAAAEAAAKSSDDPALAEMKDRYAMGDFTGALVIAEGILESHPEDLDAPRYAQSCRDVLTQMYSARLGSLDQFVRVAVPNDQIRWLTLDHRAGFLLSLIDGGSTVDQILDISGMTRLDALRIMYQLLDQRVISLGH